MWVQSDLFKDMRDLKEEDYDRMIKLIDRTEFKRRQATIGTKINRVAFGVGRRIPICKGN